MLHPAVLTATHPGRGPRKFTCHAKLVQHKMLCPGPTSPPRASAWQKALPNSSAPTAPVPPHRLVTWPYAISAFSLFSAPCLQFAEVASAFVAPEEVRPDGLKHRTTNRHRARRPARRGSANDLIPPTCLADRPNAPEMLTRRSDPEEFYRFKSSPSPSWHLVGITSVPCDLRQ